MMADIKSEVMLSQAGNKNLARLVGNPVSEPSLYFLSLI
jgi:hypothetical protein